MATKESKEKTEAVVEAVSKTDLFFKENKNLIIGVAVAAVLVAFGIFAFQKWYYQPKAREGKDAILKARSISCMGDAYVGLEDYAKALDCFVKAAGVIDNIYAAAYLLKAGVTAEQLGKNEEALKYYKTIKEQYPQSMEGYDIDKYISRLAK